MIGGFLRVNVFLQDLFPALELLILSCWPDIHNRPVPLCIDVDQPPVFVAGLHLVAFLDNRQDLEFAGDTGFLPFKEYHYSAAFDELCDDCFLGLFRHGCTSCSACSFFAYALASNALSINSAVSFAE